PSFHSSNYLLIASLESPLLNSNPPLIKPKIYWPPRNFLTKRKAREPRSLPFPSSSWLFLRAINRPKSSARLPRRQPGLLHQRYESLRKEPGSTFWQQFMSDAIYRTEFTTPPCGSTAAEILQRSTGSSISTMPLDSKSQRSLSPAAM